MRRTLFLTTALLFFTTIACEQPASQNEERESLKKSFHSLRSTLRLSAEDFNEKNMDTKALLLEKIQHETNLDSATRAQLKADIDKITAKHAGLSFYLKALVEELEKIGGWDSLSGTLSKPKAIAQNTAFWMGADREANDGSGNGAAYALRLKLEEYVSWGNDFVRAQHATMGKELFDTLQSIVVQPSGLNKGATSEDAKPVSWESHTFKDMPVVGSMAMLEKIKLDVGEIESALLQLLEERIAAVHPKSDSLATH